MKKTLMILAPVAALALGTQVATAATICAGCEVQDGNAGTYLGAYNPMTLDAGTFNHTGIHDDVGQDVEFTDFLVFDLNPGGAGSVSADFTVNTGIRDFVGRLWTDGGSTCSPGSPGTCSSIVPGTLLVVADDSSRRWEIVASGLAAGRYILQVTGRTRLSGNSTYSGQLSFLVPEPGALAMLGLGLVGLGIVRRRWTR